MSLLKHSKTGWRREGLSYSALDGSSWRT